MNTSPITIIRLGMVSKIDQAAKLVTCLEGNMLLGQFVKVRVSPRGDAFEVMAETTYPSSEQEIRKLLMYALAAEMMKEEPSQG